MKDQIKNLAANIEILSRVEFEETLPVLNELVKVINLKNQELAKQKQTELKARAKEELENLLSKTNYQEPQYPDMGIEGINGSCTFESQEQAELLIKTLVNQSYYYGHKLKWTGPGEYTIKPDYSYDHDGEVVYMANYLKEVNHV